MGCNLPMPAYQLKGGGVAIGGHHPDKPGYPIRLPCGKCTGCRLDQARGWALRCRLELGSHPSTTFVTLTYAEENLPLTLSLEHPQLWLKRLRKELGASRPIRYFLCGEYGEQRNRPHYHAILFGGREEDRAAIEKTWGLGRTQVEAITPARIAYVAGYTQKKVRDRYREREGVVDPETGEWVEWKPPFVVMSRRPGIGTCAKQHTASWKDYAVQDGYKMPIPRFLHDAWKSSVTPEEVETNKTTRQQRAAAHKKTLERLAANEEIQKAKQRIDGDRRRL